MRIYVGGLAYASSNDGLRSLFSSLGTVTEASIVEDKYSGQSKGFGFVEMPNAEEAKAAIGKLNGYMFDGRALTVNEAKPREDRGAGGGGRSFSGSGGGGGGRNRW